MGERLQFFQGFRGRSFQPVHVFHHQNDVLFLCLPEQEFEAFGQGLGTHIQALDQEFFGLHFGIQPV